MAEFRIYSSSAGSGKTYTLTREYLRLLLSSSNSFYFKKILAITFTNEAAAEMKRRILKDLLTFSSEGFGPASSQWGRFSEIAEEIRKEKPSVSDEMLMERAKNAFRVIIHEYADFSVRTIDSFVNKLVSAFTEELGLPFNYEIVLEKDPVLLEAVERMFEKAGSEDFNELTFSLRQFATDKAEDGKSWHNMPSELAQFGAFLLNDLYFNLINKISELATIDFKEIKKQLSAFNSNFEAKIKALAKQASELIAQNGLSIEDFSNKKNGIGGYFENLKNDVTLSPNSYHRKAIYDDVWYPTKAPLGTIQRIEAIKENLRAIFLEIQDWKEGDAREKKYNLFKAIIPSLTKLSLLNRIKAEFDEVLREKNQVYIAEFNRKILQIVLTEPVPFIYERLGEKFNHILIDEFQDTSDLQFYNLLPLIENALANNNFNLLVGDAKQSIYRWRGGKMELIVHLFQQNIEKLLENPLISDFQVEQFLTINRNLNPQALTTNYRSAVEIIGFNNAFFEHILQQKSTEFPLLSKAYTDFAQQHRPNAPHGGHVACVILPAQEKEVRTMDELAMLIQSYYAEGYDANDIAVLCRRNSESAQIANYLINNGFEVVSQDSLLLVSSGLVRLSIAFLKVLDQPDNKLIKYEAAYLFYQFILKQIPDTQQNRLISEVVESDDIQLFYSFFNERGYQFNSFELQKSGIYAITEKILLELRAFDSIEELPYLFGLLDLVLDFGNHQSNHLNDFLAFWNSKKDNLSVNNTTEKKAITVTTVHKSKGLEFPIVLIPYANWSYAPSNKSEIWVDLEELGFDELISETSEGQKQLKSVPFRVAEFGITEIDVQIEREKEATFIETLNLLYVAFTRPTDKLVILMNRDKRGNKLLGTAEWLQSFIESKGLVVPDEGNIVLYEGVSLKKEEKAKETLQLVFDKVISTDRADRLRLRRTSEKVFDPETLEKTKDKGNKIHAAFALIKTREDVQNALKQLLYEGVIAPSETEEIEKSIQQVINLPELTPLFSKENRIENEREILVSGRAFARPDRVVFVENNVVILDYKTGQKQEAHQTQIRKYGRLYKQMGYESIELKIVYLETNEIVQVSL